MAEAVKVKVLSSARKRSSYVDATISLGGENQLKIANKRGGPADLIVLAPDRVVSTKRKGCTYYVIITSGSKVVKIKVPTAEAQQHWFQIIDVLTTPSRGAAADIATPTTTRATSTSALCTSSHASTARIRDTSTPSSPFERDEERRRTTASIASSTSQFQAFSKDTGEGLYHSSFHTHNSDANSYQLIEDVFDCLSVSSSSAQQQSIFFIPTCSPPIIPPRPTHTLTKNYSPVWLPSGSSQQQERIVGKFQTRRSQSYQPQSINSTAISAPFDVFVPRTKSREHSRLSSV